MNKCEASKHTARYVAKPFAGIVLIRELQKKVSNIFLSIEGESGKSLKIESCMENPGSSKKKDPDPDPYDVLFILAN